MPNQFVTEEATASWKMKLSKIEPLFDKLSPNLFFLWPSDISALYDQRPAQVFYPPNLEAVTRSNLIYSCKDQVHFSHGTIKTRSVRERNKRQKGCLNITLTNDKSTLKQSIYHFSLYLAMSSVFAFKEYSLSKIPDCLAIPYVNVPIITYRAKWSKAIYCFL